MHYFSLHIGDYERDTAALSLMQHGAYSKLMRSYYATEKPLPADAESLWRICGAMSKVERMAVSFVAERFFQLDGEVLRHKRIDAEIADYRASVNNGSKGGRPKKEKPKNNLNPNLDHNLNETPPVTNHEPVTSNQVTASLTPRAGAHLPATEAQARSMAESAGVPPDYAATIWHELEGVGWEDSAGRPIGNFASYLKARYNHRQDKHAREDKRNAARTASTKTGERRASGELNQPGRYAS